MNCIGALAWLLLPPAMAMAQAAPAVVRLTPEHGRVDVDWQQRTLEVRFDRDMVMTSCSCGGAGTTLPRISTTEWLDARTLRLSVVLDPESAYSLELSGASGRGLYAADGGRLPPLRWQFCTTATAPVPLAELLPRNQRAYELLTAAVREHYAYGDLAGIDWREQFDRHRDAMLTAPTLAALALASTELLAPAQDPHLTVRYGRGLLPTMVRDVRPNVQPESLARALPSLQRIDRHVAVARTDDGIGYLQLDTFRRDERDSVDRAIDALRSMRDSKALIIDVRGNAGGDEAVARLLAAWFVRGQRVYAAHTVRNLDSPGGFDARQDQVIRGNPQPDRYDGPVAVLSGPMNMSGAESFLLMMRQAANVRLIGARSYGSSDHARSFALAPGLAVLLPCWRALRPDGTCIEGDGIVPDITVAATPAQLQGDDLVLQRALEYLRAQ